MYDLSNSLEFLTDIAVQAATVVRVRDAAKDSLKMCWRVGPVDPSLLVPANYSLRAHSGSTMPEGWDDTLQSAGLTATPESWKREYSNHDTVAVYLVKYAGKVVATAGLRRLPGGHAGLLHLVGVAPDHQRRGLGRLVTAAAMRGATSAGLAHMFLSTDDHRLPAIRTYVSLGFRPCLNSWDRTHRWRWRRIGLGPWSDIRPCRDTSHRGYVETAGE